MGFTYRAYLDEEAKRCKIYACSNCRSHLSTFDHLISKVFFFFFFLKHFIDIEY
jgi:hypothetical protein